MKRIKPLFTGFCLIIIVSQVWAYVAMDIQKWEIDKAEVIRSYIHTLSYKTYTLSQLKGYSNKLLNYILAIDENYKNRLIVLRVTGDITRDFIFINNKLYVITDYMQKSSEDYILGAIAQLKKKYGVPQKQSEGATTTYTFTRDETKVIAIGENKGTNCSLTIYYYYKNLFRSLMQ